MHVRFLDALTDDGSRRQARSYFRFLSSERRMLVQPVEFLHRVPRLANAVLSRSAVRLARLVEAASLHVELPPVIAAADTVLVDLAVVERRPAMGAARSEQTGPLLAIAEQDEVFAQVADVLRPRHGARV